MTLSPLLCSVHRLCINPCTPPRDPPCLPTCYSGSKRGSNLLRVTQMKELGFNLGLPPSVGGMTSSLPLRSVIIWIIPGEEGRAGRILEPSSLREEARKWVGCAQGYRPGRKGGQRGCHLCVFRNPRGQSCGQGGNPREREIV